MVSWDLKGSKENMSVARFQAVGKSFGFRGQITLEQMHNLWEFIKNVNLILTNFDHLLII